MGEMDGRRHEGDASSAWDRLDGVDAVLFDLDGVLTRTDKLHASAWKQLFDTVLPAHRGEGDTYPFRLPEDYLRYLDGKPRFDGVRTFLASRGIALPEGQAEDPPGTETVCAVGNSKEALFVQLLDRDGVEVFPGSIELLSRLRQAGKRTACVSSSRNTKRVLHRVGLKDAFDAVVDGLDLEHLRLPGKPAPDPYLEGARRLGVPPGRAAVIEDAMAGVASGRAGGFALVIGLDRGAGDCTLRDAGADLVLRDLGEALHSSGYKATPGSR